jgi:hypothetical protein
MLNSFIDINCIVTRCAVIVQPLQYSAEGRVLLKQDKQFVYMPQQAVTSPVGSGLRISRLSAYEGGKAVSPTPRPPSPQMIALVITSIID